MKPLLSVLIPCTPDRRSNVSELLGIIEKQHFTRKATVYGISNIDATRYWDILSEIEILIFEDNREMTIGEKREMLYQHAIGLYSWQIDSDDTIAPDAIEHILAAIKSNPEIPCITFRENCMMWGQYKTCNHSLQYFQWADNANGFDFCRSPFYKDVIRTDIAKSVPFPHTRYNEDEQWSAALRPHLSDEIHIDKELYFYVYDPKESHEERYGINENQ